MCMQGKGIGTVRRTMVKAVPKNNGEVENAS
jgi:hypothetical protein